MYRDEDESATDSTDDDTKWGGPGKFEYSGKGLPHALFHQLELVLRGGHHMTFCSFASEQAHKVFIKLAAQFARVYASLNKSQESMLKWVNEAALFKAVIRFGNRTRPKKKRVSAKAVQLRDPQPYSKHWSAQRVRNNRLPVSWERQFVSGQVRLTNLELMRILCSKLKLEDATHTHVLLAQHLSWEFYGSLVLNDTTSSRKFVGVSPTRRDFVHLETPRGEDTCLSAQVLVFVKISGFQDLLTLPSWLRCPKDNYTSVTLALVRWLSPHPNAILRDPQRRPLCPSPFDVNHALWTFTKQDRPDLTDHVVFENSESYPDTNSITSEKTARFDLIQIRYLKTYMNCTVIDDYILETITIPF